MHLRRSRECIPGNPGCTTLRVYEFHVQDHTRSACTRMWLSYVNVHVWHGALGLPPLNAKDDRLGRVGRSWSGWHPPRRCGDSEMCVRMYMHIRAIIHGVPEGNNHDEQILEFAIKIWYDNARLMTEDYLNSVMYHIYAYCMCIYL